MDDLSAAVSAKLTFEGLIWKNASLLRPCICTSRHNSSRIAIFRSPMRSEISYKIDARPEKNWTKHCPGIPKMLRIQFHIKAGSHQKKKHQPRNALMPVLVFYGWSVRYPSMGQRRRLGDTAVDFPVLILSADPKRYFGSLRECVLELFGKSGSAH
jgi:hypothetical protein